VSQSHLPGLKIPPSASSSMWGRRHRCAGVQVGHRHVTASSRIVGQVSPPSSAVGIRRLVTRTRDWPSDRASSHEQVAVRGCWQVSCSDHVRSARRALPAQSICTMQECSGDELPGRSRAERRRSVVDGPSMGTPVSRVLFAESGGGRSGARWQGYSTRFPAMATSLGFEGHRTTAEAMT
jgi:hypothetical protein